MSADMDELAGDLAYARLAAKKLSHLEPHSGRYHQTVAKLLVSFAALDNGGVFSKIDDHTNYEDAEDTLRRIKAQNLPRKDPAEWGDSSGYVSGDHIDFSGSVYEAPVVGKSVYVGEARVQVAKPTTEDSRQP